MTEVVIILPAYNEAQTIAATIEGFAAACPEARIIVVENNSSDDTFARALVATTAVGNRGLVIQEFRQGKANAIRKALRNIDGDVYVMVDADMTYPPGSLRELMAPVVDGSADMVVGDRLSGGHYAEENKRPFHNLGNGFVRNLINFLFRTNLADIMSGYRVFNRRLAKSYPILVGGFELEVDMTLFALHHRFAIREISVPYVDRPVGSHSKLSTFRDGTRIVFTIFQIMRYYRPLTFFGCLSAVFLLAGFGAGSVVVLEWIRTGVILRLPLAVLAASLEVGAMMLLAIGLILDSIARQELVEFERFQLSKSTAVASS